MYCEDTDLSQALRAAGYELVFEPPRWSCTRAAPRRPGRQLLPVLAASSTALRRPSTDGRAQALLEAAEIALGALTHAAPRSGRRAGPRRPCSEPSASPSREPAQS